MCCCGPQPQLGCTSRFVRLFILLINFLGMLVGLIVLGIGVYTLLTKDNPTGYSNDKIAIATIVLGGVIAVISAIGFCGSWTHSPRVLRLYFGLLTLLIVLQIVMAIIVYTRLNSKDSILDDNWSTLFNSNKNVISDLENYYSCCGWKETNDRSVPDNCSAERNFTTACKEPVTRGFEKGLRIVSISLLALAVIQIIGMLGSCCLWKSINRSQARARAAKASDASSVTTAGKGSRKSADMLNNPQMPQPPPGAKPVHMPESYMMTPVPEQPKPKKKGLFGRG
ncbi:Tetraspannin-domain-containing protein [Ramicandelaber brevisporus]|nr:Tetraspannin-domain-containing protein [Ramicandelaber brevisporus]